MTEKVAMLKINTEEQEPISQNTFDIARKVCAYFEDKKSDHPLQPMIDQVLQTLNTWIQYENQNQQVQKEYAKLVKAFLDEIRYCFDTDRALYIQLDTFLRILFQKFLLPDIEQQFKFTCSTIDTPAVTVRSHNAIAEVKRQIRGVVHASGSQSGPDLAPSTPKVQSPIQPNPLSSKKTLADSRPISGIIVKSKVRVDGAGTNPPESIRSKMERKREIARKLAENISNLIEKHQYKSELVAILKLLQRFVENPELSFLTRIEEITRVLSSPISDLSFQELLDGIYDDQS